MTSEQGEALAVFLFGGVPAGIVSFQLFGDIVFPMMLACLTGFVGGGFALLGKDFYRYIKGKFFNDEP